jgi:hypothetical protein
LKTAALTGAEVHVQGKAFRGNGELRINLRSDRVLAARDE